MVAGLEASDERHHESCVKSPSPEHKLRQTAYKDKIRTLLLIQKDAGQS